jgi:ribonuclease HI
MKKVEIYTDGACSKNPGPGGWGAILKLGEHEKELSGYVPSTTNNRMELQAVIEGLNALKEPCAVDIYTDSQYVQKGMTEWIHKWIAKGWLREGQEKIKNVDLWQKLMALSQKHKLNFHWVKGHNGHVYNERADVLATEAIKKVP